MAQVFDVANEENRVNLVGAVCAIGVFDGVHLGHRLVIGRAIEDARSQGRKSVVFTFDIDPDELFAPDALEKLQTNEERIETLASLPVDYVAIMPFGREVASLGPEEFLDEYFGSTTPAAAYVGSDFRFGAHAAGDGKLLEQWGSEHGMAVNGIELLEIDGAPVKSTRIRKLLDEGKESEANRLLGRD